MGIWGSDACNSSIEGDDFKRDEFVMHKDTCTRFPLTITHSKDIKEIRYFSNVTKGMVAVTLFFFGVLLPSLRTNYEIVIPSFNHKVASILSKEAPYHELENIILYQNFK